MKLTALSDRFSILKPLIVVLLTINIVLFAIFDSPLSTFDTLIWVLLLLSYEFEALKIKLPISPKQLILFRQLLILPILLVFIGYLLNAAWMDVSNSLLWLALIGLLELEMRQPAWIAVNQQLFWRSTMLVFIGLLVMVGIWIYQGAWLDAYDGMLWILAFGIIEIDIFSFIKLNRPAT